MLKELAAAETHDGKEQRRRNCVKQYNLASDTQSEKTVGCDQVLRKRARPASPTKKTHERAMPAAFEEPSKSQLPSMYFSKSSAS